jgi:hypothetical protein
VGILGFVGWKRNELREKKKIINNFKKNQRNVANLKKSNQQERKETKFRENMTSRV